MNSILVYTFRTNNQLDAFRKAKMDVFVFGRLKKDLEIFKNKISTLKPEFIIGLALVKGKSRFESVALNKFGTEKVVTKSGLEIFNLHIPKSEAFIDSNVPTTSFCNWTMFKLSELAEKENFKVSFLHYNENDLQKVINLIENWEG